MLKKLAQAESSRLAEFVAARLNAMRDPFDHRPYHFDGKGGVWKEFGWALRGDEEWLPAAIAREERLAADVLASSAPYVAD